MAGRWSAVAAGAALWLAAAPACSPRDDGQPDLGGTTVEVMAVWDDAEARNFTAVLRAFEAATGATTEYTSTAGADIAAVLDARVAAGDPPDVAILPQPGLLARYARQGTLTPLDGGLAGQVRASYGREWQRLGTVDGTLYGVWFKAANKSLIWYSIGAFERAGVVPPSRLDSLSEVAARLSTSGTPAFSVAGAAGDAWTLTDFFENLYLRMGGPERYDALAARRLPWTDPTVVDTLELMAGLLGPVRNDLDFPAAVAAVFSPTPRAAMVVEGDFVPGVAGDTEAQMGIDVDVVAFPERRQGERLVVGAGDAAVLLAPGAGGRELMRFLASPAAAEVWAARGGFVSPNEAVDLAAYPDDTTRSIARALLEAGDGFRFDLSDLQPVEFGGTTGAGMWAILRQYLSGPGDAASTAAALEAAAAAAWKE